MHCPVCKGSLDYLFNKKILRKYDVSYFECENCQLVKTEKPYWLAEAYSVAISDLDTGLVQRNITFADKVEQIVKNSFNRDGRFLDYAGGYGLLTRLMRDKGYDWYTFDKYCDPIFAHHFRHSKNNRPYALVTAFEVLEHVQNPIELLQELLGLGDAVLLSTELRPLNKRELERWWYLIPESGQHVQFYSRKSMEIIAERLGVFCQSNGASFHLLKKNRAKIMLEDNDKKGPKNLLSFLRSVICDKSRSEKIQKLNSLTFKDHIYIKEILGKSGK